MHILHSLAETSPLIVFFHPAASHAIWKIMMPESECATFQKLKEQETRAHATWTSFLYRNEVKPRLSDKAKRKHQKEEMEAYQQAHKARLAHSKTCSICKKQ